MTSVSVRALQAAGALREPLLPPGLHEDGVYTVVTDWGGQVIIQRAYQNGRVMDGHLVTYSLIKGSAR